MNLRLVAIVFGSLFVFSAMAAEIIPFNVKGFWYRGRIYESKIAYIDDINAQMESDYHIEDIQADVEANGCISPFVQLSVKAMLDVFGPSRKIKITQIATTHQVISDFSDAPCTYQWRGGRTGVVCLGEVCVGTL